MPAPSEHPKTNTKRNTKKRPRPTCDDEDGEDSLVAPPSKNGKTANSKAAKSKDIVAVEYEPSHKDRDKRIGDKSKDRRAEVASHPGSDFEEERDAEAPHPPPKAKKRKKLGSTSKDLCPDYGADLEEENDNDHYDDRPRKAAKVSNEGIRRPRNLKRTMPPMSSQLKPDQIPRPKLGRKRQRPLTPKSQAENPLSAPTRPKGPHATSSSGSERVPHSIVVRRGRANLTNWIAFRDPRFFWRSGVLPLVVVLRDVDRSIFVGWFWWSCTAGRLLEAIFADLGKIICEPSPWGFATHLTHVGFVAAWSFRCDVLCRCTCLRKQLRTLRDRSRSPIR
ncbi:hypothetical protein PAXRUDRAFT_702249 [Paxillus rubicundulus Ve08.2h10]|uniref:Uncharacterized protein n=1 Tax=Paxillus rubicundulus Ve08.2h10 TaxID=930991 RepID=A0A0D0E880_9AGAM|nr:hypothetical protein PAXRUDRAFT_702249 [Paxillus rubicundulus Ve08.2h10]